MRKVRLYIGNQLVDLPEGVSLPITYTTEDFKNPTIVKNSFSKTISLPNTDTNNKIFNHFYKLDRYQNNSGFNPSKRVDAKIYCDGELLESGYIQLNSITGIGEDKKYNITMYGGLGDFFYGLKYNEDGTTKTLADLQFFVLDDNNRLRPKEEELTFNINKEFVSKCFDKDWDANGDKITDFITFIPANNGLYEDFDNGHCLIVPDGTTFPTSVKDGDVTYTPKDGFALASLEKDYTEWQMRDLRSYKQRPAIKVSKLIETICREANSGYKVNFDKAFFSNSNPYWSKSFIALPLLGSEAEGGAQESSKMTLSSAFPFWVGVQDNTGCQEQYANLTPDTYFDVTGNYMDLSNLPELAELNVEFDMQLRFHPEKTDVDEWFMAAYYSTFMGAWISGNSFTAQLLLIDEDGETVGYSNLYNFTGKPSAAYSEPNPDRWDQYVPIVPEASVTNVFGSFKKVGDDYYWFTEKGGNTVRLTISNWIRKSNKVKLGLSISCQSTWRKDQGIFSTGIGFLYDKDSFNKSETGNPDVMKSHQTYGWYDPLFDAETSRITAKWENPIVSNAPITKEMLLKTEASPADYLLSYAKMFGLYFVKDVDSKTITIYNRNSFFQNEVEDWTDKIDYSKDMTITPLLFDKKWYLMSLDTPETYFAKKYNTEYDLTYGQQRLDTGYNFNSEITELYSDNVFENIISATDSDKYFRNFYNSKGTLVPAFLNDNITYTLYNGDESFDSDIYGYYTVDPSKTQDWSVTSGADLFAKPCFFSIDGDEKGLEEITNALVMYNGHKDLVDYRGSQIPMWISDDLSEMALLNEKTACFLWTDKETYNDEKIAVRKTRLPQYISYRIDKNNNVTESLDFGLPREMYVDKVNYSEDTTIYANFWDSFYRDQFNVNTKKVTCYVKLERAKQDLLRKFYFFDNAIWLLNKIDSYDVTSYGTTRCEFIKVQDMNNYLYGVKDYSNIFEVTGKLDPTSTSAVLTLESSYDWTLYDTNFSSVSPNSGTAGEHQIAVTYWPNQTTSPLYYRLEFTHSGTTLHKIFTFVLEPDPTNYINVKGMVTGYPSGARLYIEREGGATSSIMLSGDIQDYSIYVAKNTPFRLYVQYDDVTYYDESFTGSDVDIVHNIEIDYEYFINWSTDLPIVDGYIEVDWDTLSIPVTITSNVDWLYVDGSSTSTMSPGSGTSGTTLVEIKPYEENIYDTPITGYVQLEDTGDLGVITLIRWRQRTKPADITVSGIVTGAPEGSTLYIERSTTTQSSLIYQDSQTYSFTVPANTPFRMSVVRDGEKLYEKSFDGSAVDVVNNISIEYAYYINYETDLPKDGEYIVVDWDTLSIPITVTANVPWLYADGSSTCTMTPGNGNVGTTSVEIQPYEENIYDTEITGYVQLEDINEKGVTTIIRWKQLPQN